MIFDFTPLLPNHAVFFGLSFLGTFWVVQVATKRSRQPGTVYFAGTAISLLIAAIVIAALGVNMLSVGLAVAAVLGSIIGTIDEKRNVRPHLQFAAQVMLATIVALSGWVVTKVSHPSGNGVIELTRLGIEQSWNLPAVVVTILWLVFLINSMNWIDGSDGLAAGVGLVAFITLALVSLLPSTQDATTITLALIGAGAISAFLIWNWPPAKAYLGTTGIWFLGLYIGIVAIIGGGKIATTLLVLAVPAADAIAVSAQRILSRTPPWRGDRTRHLHHRLRGYGLKPQAIVIVIMVITAVCALAALVLQTSGKIVVLLVVGLLLIGLNGTLWLRQNRARAINKRS